MVQTSATMLYISLALLMTSAAIELAFISSMVYWLHYYAGGAFDIRYNSTTFSLHGKPLNLLVNQGHTSNGAAGTAFVIVGLGGILALSLRNRAARTGRARSFSIGLYYTWLVFVILSTLLTLAALVYTFDLTYTHAGQTINIALASVLHNEPYPNYVAYPDDAWTPENWFTAVLQLPLASSSVRSDIQLHLAVIKGWRWNLIPLLVFGMAVMVFAIVDATQRRRPGRDSRGAYELAEGKRLSA